MEVLIFMGKSSISIRAMASMAMLVITGGYSSTRGRYDSTHQTMTSPPGRFQKTLPSQIAYLALAGDDGKISRDGNPSDLGVTLKKKKKL